MALVALPIRVAAPCKVISVVPVADVSVLALTNESVQEIHTLIVIGPTGFAPDDVALRNVTTICESTIVT